MEPLVFHNDVDSRGRGGCDSHRAVEQNWKREEVRETREWRVDASLISSSSTAHVNTVVSMTCFLDQ